MKKWYKWIIAVVAALLLISVIKDFAIKAAVEKGVELTTGLKMRIGFFRAGIFNSTVGIGNLKIYNPPQFRDSVMVDMPKVYVKYDLPAILRGDIHLKNLDIYLKEFVVTKNEKGELNLDSLRVVKESKLSGKGGQKSSGGQAAPPKVSIDNFILKIDKAVYRDYSAPGGLALREFNINLNERYTNVDNAYAVVSLIVVKALANTSISGMTNFDMSGMQNSVGNMMKSAHGVASRATEAVDATKKGIQKAADVFGGAMKNPFGEGK